MALEIINRGCGRTGTPSLKLAHERLGFGPAHHMFEVRDNPAPLRHGEAVARGEPVDWDEVIDGWAPLCSFLGVDVPDEPFPWSNRTQAFTHEAWRID